MVVFGWIVISAVLAAAVIGAIAACVDDEKGLGKEFLEGIYAIGYIFLPVAGIMASVPFLAAFIRVVFSQAFSFVGADPAMAATTFIAVDMGGYMLARELTPSTESWITAMTAGYMAGATIVFSIPVGLAMLQKRDHKYMALGVMAGLLSIPIGVLIANLIIWMIQPHVHQTVTTTQSEPTYPLILSLPQLLRNLTPLALIMGFLALGLRLAPDLMIRLFMAFGRLMGILIKMVLVLCIVEYFTVATFQVGLFAKIFGSWEFAPVIVNADQVTALAGQKTFDGRMALEEAHILRALEVAGYIGIMLAGAFPMVYLIRKYFAKPVEAFGRKIGLDAVGAAGMLATIANILAMFRLVKDMRPRDKVLNISFAVCAAFLFGDHLAFTTNFQKTLLLPIMLGKLSGGICGFLIATWLCLPKAKELEEADLILDAKAILQDVPSLKGKSLIVTKIAGGMTNLIFKVEDLDAAYVLRVFGAGTEQLGINRDREVACSQAAAAIGVGPEVIAYLPEHHALLCRFVPGKLLDDSDAQKSEVLRRIAETLKRCHAAPISDEIGTFSVFATVRDYLAKAETQGVELPKELGDALVLLHRIEKDAKTDEPPRVCHNDLLAGNFIDDGAVMHIIDWEYGALGDPFFDLGNFAANLKMTEDQENALLQGYFGEVRPVHLRRLRLMRLASDMREASWGFLQQAISKLGAPKGYKSYFDYGMKHLQRFLTEAKRWRLS